ncbi:MAG: hypothetical protein ACLSB9_35260 [Hydrogeniiclostridium mannosilyticum]
MLFLISGKIVGIPARYRRNCPTGSSAGLWGHFVCAVQLFQSAIRAFAPPVAFGLAGAGLMFAAGWG